MLRKTESSFLLILLATCMLALTLKIQPVKADIGIWIGSDGSVSPPGAPILREGDLYTLTGNITVNGTSGMYVEGIDIERDNMTLDGAGYTVQGHEFWGTGLYISNRNNVTVENLNIRTFDAGILWSSSSECTLTGNNATMNNVGFAIESSSNNTLSDNRATGNEGGIRLDVSSNNVLSQNVIENNTYNLGIFGGQLSGYVNSIDTSNLVNGKPVYYLVNQENLVLEPATCTNVGFVGFVDCNNITVANLTISDNYEGLMLANTTNSLITQNTIANNYDGIYMYSSNDTVSNNTVTENDIAGLLLYSSSNNTISGNNVTANVNCGIWLESSVYNIIYQNDFVNNTPQVHLLDSEPNSWDNGYPSGGNYWSDYNGADSNKGPYQNETGSDGIGDTPYTIDPNNTDHYPLMESTSVSTTPEFPSIITLLTFMALTATLAAYSKKRIQLKNKSPNPLPRDKSTRDERIIVT